MSGSTVSILSHWVFKENETDIVLSFLDIEELEAIEVVSKAWASVAPRGWKILAKTLQMGVDPLPSGLSYRQIVKNLAPGSLGLQFYRDYFGGNALPVVPVPKSYIEASNQQDLAKESEKIRDNFQLTFLPEFIRIVVPATCTLTLNEKGNLIEDPNAIGWERKMDVPVTLNNMALLTERCLKQGDPTGFYKKSWKNILDQHGDTRIQSHWFYPRKDLIGIGSSYDTQKGIAAAAGLEISSFIDTAIYYLLRKIRLGDSDIRYVARTSTETLDDPDPPKNNVVPPREPRISSLWWSLNGPEARLAAGRFWGASPSIIGAAVNVPAGSSQVIVT
jgi:hypothetical protein